MNISLLNVSVCRRILTPLLLEYGSCYLAVWFSSRSLLVVCLTAQTRCAYIHISNINSAFGSEVFSLLVQVTIPGSDHGSNKVTRPQMRKRWCYVRWSSNRLWALQCGFLWTIGHRQLFRNREAYVSIYYRRYGESLTRHNRFEPIQRLPWVGEARFTLDLPRWFELTVLAAWIDREYRMVAALQRRKLSMF